MIIVSNVEFSCVPFVEFNIKYYGYSPLFFPDSGRTNKVTHANICASSSIQRLHCHYKNQAVRTHWTQRLFFICIQKKFPWGGVLKCTAFTKSMEIQIHVLILTQVFPLFTILLILLIGNIPFLLHTKYQTRLSNILEVMAFNMTEGWIPKSALSLFELKSTFFFMVWNLDFRYRFLFVNCDW